MPRAERGGRRPLRAAAGLAALLVLAQACALNPPRYPAGIRGPLSDADLYPAIVAWGKVQPASPEHADAARHSRKAEIRLAKAVERHLASAREDSARGDLDGALQYLRQAAALDPRRAEVAEQSRRFAAVRDKVQAAEARLRDRRAAGDWNGAKRENDSILALIPDHAPSLERRRELAASAKHAAQESFRQGQELLRAGDGPGARLAYIQTLLLDPEHRGVRQALKAEALGERPALSWEWVPHKVKEGETVYDLSERFYGQSAWYPLIAAFNNLPDPPRLEAGSTLRIPRLEIEEPKAAGRQEGGNASSRPHATWGAAILQEARDLLEAGDTKGAGALASRVLAAEPENRAARDILADSLYRRGLDDVEGKRWDKALEDLAKLREVAPGWRDSESLASRARQGLTERVDRLYKEGITLYRAQRLPEALERWDEVLRLEPAHDGARKFSAQARRLMDKLQEMD